MSYPEIPNFQRLGERLAHYVQLKHERGASGLTSKIKQAEQAMLDAIAAVREMAEDPALAAIEPDALAAIQALRPAGPRTLPHAQDDGEYARKLEGALLARCAGCTLGAPVELWSVEKMEALARELGEPFPPTDYWSRVPDPFTLRYETSARESYTRSKIDGVPVDDDITYTLLGLLIAEEHGLQFSTEDVGETWARLLPHAMTAEAIALENVRKGLPASEAAEQDNPYCEWIGGDIRVDPWGYLAPGRPQQAAEMAYRDSFLSHRRQGIYGSMFFAAAISAAFVVNDPLEAIRIGLTEIPEECALAKAVHWALEVAPGIRNYEEARQAVDVRFAGMHPVHTNNNACLTIFGLSIGGTDVTRVIGETVAMGLDNDCTAATAGSIVGAIVGAEGIPSQWTRPFKGKIHTYLNGHPTFDLADVVRRFSAIRTK